MRSKAVLWIFVFIAGVMVLGLGARASLGMPQAARDSVWTTQERVVFLLGQLSEEDVITATTTIAASGHRGVVLFDHGDSRGPTRHFLKEFGAACVVPVGPLAEGTPALLANLSVPTLPAFAWRRGANNDLGQVLFPTAERIVVTPTEPHRLLLQAAHLAGVLKAPLFTTRGKTTDTAELEAFVKQRGVKEIHAVGKAVMHCRNLESLAVTRLKDEDAVRLAASKQLAKEGPVQSLVVANPNDQGTANGRMSSLAPWIALQRRAALLLTDDTGSNIDALVREATTTKELARAENLILVGNLQALPVQKRPNPIEGGRDEFIEMEPLTSKGTGPCSFAVGRLFHNDPNLVALMLARQRLLARETGSPKALIISNPGGGLPLLETYSRNTANEFKNAGYDVKAFFHQEANKNDLRRLLPEQTIFLWEGHHSTLVNRYGIHNWPEPLKPSLVYLQSCLALEESKAQPFLERGAIGLIGTSTRTYSGSGGAMSLAYFDALLYEDQSLGGALRQAKNFMLAFVQLKEKRLGDQAKLSGANLRAAWSFTLWGDPTVKLPKAPRPESALPPVKHEVRGNVIAVQLPVEKHAKVMTEKYLTEMRPNARLAGLRLKQQEEERHPLVPFVFVEVELPAKRAGQTPTLRTTLPGSHWTFCYDARLERGYLLMTPRTKDQGELRFSVSWN